MALDPDLAEQRLIAEGWERRPVRLSVEERRSELLLGAAYCVAAAVVALIAPFHAASIHVAAAALCAVGVALAMRIEFYAGGGFTVPTQLAFVPLLFALPPALVPPIVIAAGIASKVPDVVAGRRQVTRLLLMVNNSWFAIGPAAVLGIAGVPDASAAGPVLLAAAFAAQFAGDFAASAVREAMLRGASLREQLGELWVYAVDIGLTPAGVLAGVHVREQPWSVLALMPVLAVLATFARERQARVASLVELSSAYRGTALVLGDVIEADDGYTGTHSRSVVELAIAVGERLGLDASRRRNLEFGALLHDVGKIAIPKAIINKPGMLDPDEWAVIKTHTVEGQAMLDRVGGFMREVGKIVRSHHERWDGLGYPDGLSGHDIPIEARIIACCDSFNAMTTTRAYRPAMSDDAALTELRSNSGLQFDPDVVDATIAVITAPERARAEARRQPAEFAAVAAPAT